MISEVIFYVVLGIVFAVAAVCAIFVLHFEVFINVILTVLALTFIMLGVSGMLSSLDSRTFAKK